MFLFVLVILIHLNNNHIENYQKLDVDTAESRQLTLEAAQQSIVLLKNVNKALPLNINQLQNKKIALIGPSANATRINARKLSWNSTIFN